MTFKSILGRAALEELKEDEIPNTEEGKDTDTDTDASSAEGGDAAAAGDGDVAGAATTTEEGATADTAADATDPNADAPANTDTDAAATNGEGDDTAAAGDVAPDAGTGDGDVAAAGGTSSDASFSDEAGTGGDSGGDIGAGDDTATGDDAGAAGEGDTDADPAAAADADDAAAVNAATSDADAAGDAGDVVPDEAGDVDAELIVDEMNEVDRIDDNLADADDDVEKLTEATEALEGLVAILDAGVQRGGFDAIGGALVRHNLNTITTNLKVRPMMIPALEDMESPTARIGAASNTKDQVVKFIKRIIDTIKEAFVRVGQWIVETYKRLTNAFVAIERRAEKLAEMVKASKMKEGNLDNKALVGKLQINGKPVADLKSALSNIDSFARYANDPKSYSNYLQALDLCEEMIKAPEKAEEIRGQVSQKLAAWGEEFHRSASKYKLETVNGKSADDSGVQRFGVSLLGNQTTEIVIPTTAEKIGVMSAATHNLSDTGAAGDIAALDQSAALAICQVVAETAKALRESAEGNKGGVKEVNAEIAKRKDTMVAMMSSKMNNVESAEVVRKVALFVNTFFMSAPKIPAHAINKAMPRNLAVALDYVAASIGGKAGDESAPALGNSAPKALPAA